MKIARKDYIQLSYVYGGAVFLVIFLSVIAIPMDMSHFGLIVPNKPKEQISIYGAEAFADVKVGAKAYVVYDLVDRKVIAAKDGDVSYPLASLTKVMTAVSALSHHDPTTPITIRDEFIDGGYDLGLKKGQTWKLGELLKYTLVFSSNDGAAAIAGTLGGREVFINQMNTDSALLGLSLVFTDPAGLDEGGKWGGTGTALDVAKLFAVARRKYPEVLEATTHTRVTVRTDKGALTGVPNTNQEINSLFGAEASKTGFTDDAGGNLAVVVDVALGHPVAIVVLGSTREGRFEDVTALYEALIKSIK